MSFSVSPNLSASVVTLPDLPRVNAEPVQIPGELAVLTQLNDRYKDSFLREPRHGDPWPAVTDGQTLPTGVTYGADTSGPLPVQDDNYRAVAPDLKNFLNFGESSLTAFQARQLAYKLGLSGISSDLASSPAHPGDRVELSYAGSDGQQRVTRGIVTSASNEGITVLGVGEDGRFTTFFQSASQPAQSSANITEVITPAAS